MYVQKLSSGGFLVPGGSTVNLRQETLRGYGGIIFLLNLPIPQNSKSYLEFCESIRENEITFGKEVDRIQAISLQ
jgi:hypothetical protein